MQYPTQFKPESPDDFIGHTKRLANILFAKLDKLKANPAPIKWLFTGPPGVGKTALADLLAIKIAQHPLGIDFTNGQSLTVDVVRAWRDGMHYRPMFGAVGVKRVDEFDLASPAAQNELLSYLDRLPNWLAMIATTNQSIGQLVPRLQSRFQISTFKPISADEMIKWFVEYWKFDKETVVQMMMKTTYGGDVRAALADLESLQDTMGVK